MFTPPDANNTVQLLQYVNTTLVHSMLGIGLLLLLWVILFVRMNVVRSKMAFASASFFTGIASIMFWGLGILNDYFLIFFLAMAIISAIVLTTSAYQD